MDLFRYVGSPIQCWMPMEFKGGWEQYAEDYCFIQNTFFVPFHEEIPADDEDRSKRSLEDIRTLRDIRAHAKFAQPIVTRNML
ncbi:hypothetical protein ANCDUO_00061 [Ancylostoma duodenale]|uniref:Innexin n=1 Tax=Ancylostoma duodenale TaxID=51022 RepID=A0A0C2E2D4_9BILA|nr:hypothetical protein ANCDUO_00061 [Ancylostoma duodenale]